MLSDNDRAMISNDYNVADVDCLCNYNSKAINQLSPA